MNRTRSHVRVSGSVLLDLGKISQRRKDPKKAVQHAAQKTSLLAGSQLLDAISGPIVSLKEMSLQIFAVFETKHGKV